jgi:hypothetical protein
MLLNRRFYFFPFPPLDEPPLLLPPLDLDPPDRERDELDLGVEDRLGGLYDERLELFGVLERFGEDRFMLDELLLLLLLLLRGLTALGFFWGVRLEFGL